MWVYMCVPVSQVPLSVNVWVCVWILSLGECVHLCAFNKSLSGCVSLVHLCGRRVKKRGVGSIVHREVICVQGQFVLWDTGLQVGGASSSGLGGMGGGLLTLIPQTQNPPSKWS